MTIEQTPLHLVLSEESFLRDPRRRASDEVDLGGTWRAAGSPDTWRLAWLRATGELYACTTDGLDGSASCVRVLAVLADERAVDAALEGWRDARFAEDGLGWAMSRVALAA